MKPWSYSKTTASYFDAQSTKSLAVIGDNASMQHASGSGSSGVKALYEIALQALQDYGETRISTIYGYPVAQRGWNQSPPASWRHRTKRVSAVGVWNYANRGAPSDAKPALVKVVPSIDFDQDQAIDAGHRWKLGRYFKGSVTPPKAGPINLSPMPTIIMLFLDDKHR